MLKLVSNSCEDAIEYNNGLKRGYKCSFNRTIKLSTSFLIISSKTLLQFIGSLISIYLIFCSFFLIKGVHSFWYMIILKWLERNSCDDLLNTRTQTTPHTKHIRHTHHTTHDTHHTTHNTPHTTQHTTHDTYHKTHNTRHSSHGTQHTTYITRHTSYDIEHTTHITRHTSHNTHHTTHNIRHTAHDTH